MVWCGEIMCNNGFQEVRASIFFFGVRLFSYVSGTNWLLWECFFFFPSCWERQDLKELKLFDLKVIF